MRNASLILCLLLGASMAQAQVWKPLGPPGGDVRALATDPVRPERAFLGTADGHVFGSEDSGAHWTVLGRASSRLDAVITAIVVDPRDGNVIYASSWARNSGAGGGIFRSADAGHTWSAAGLAGQAVRALALAASDPDLLVAGTLDGVYRSKNAGKSWERISPEHDEELRNLDSLAIDPRDPNTIYAGTFHLPWKTSDGGRSWNPIHAGMIDDSDVMSLLIDRQTAGRVYASACSGIYRSDDGAGQWRKIQGIPYTARRTYAIAQDPGRPGTVYAATSEGLWKTADAGMTWKRTTPESWVVNAVVISGGNPSRVLIGTEELGVLASDDEGEHFQDANSGFDHRQILALALDARRPGRVLAVLAHAPEAVVATDNDGGTWAALGPGLRAEQALRVYAAPDDAWWVSLAGGGLMRYDAAKKSWLRTGVLVGEAGGAGRAAEASAALGTAASKRTRMKSSTPLMDLVSDMAFSSNAWYAATERGLLVSVDRGAKWARQPVGPLSSLPVQAVRVSGGGARIRVVSQRGLVFSDDGGKFWNWHDLPLSAGAALTLETLPGDESTLVAAAQNGLYISHDAGNTWMRAASGLPATTVQGFAATGGVFVASMRTGGLYVSTDAGRTWDRVSGTLADGFFAAVSSSGESGVVFAASTTEGLYKVEWHTAAARSSSTVEIPKQAMQDGARPTN